MLRENGGYVSGQELCRQLGVSRTAVWKTIRRLQEEGYQIEAEPGKGYRITGYPDTVAEAEVESRLETTWIGHPVRYYKELTSTNLYAKQMAEEGASEGLLVVADMQTRGKGRVGRAWSTIPGTTIAMTLMLRPDIAPDRISMVTLIMGLAVARACRDICGVPAMIKWPNDVVVNGRKICGILTEMSMEITAVSYIVIGVGINVNVKSFPEDLRDKATSLFLELGRETNRASLIAGVMRLFEQYYERFLEEGDLRSLQDAYNELLVNKGKGVRVLEPGNEYSGVAGGIDKAGQLTVQKEDGTTALVYAGEVSVRGIYGYV